MADRFYVKSELGIGPVLLEGPEAHHLRTVCRLRPGDRVCLFNGDGREYPARVVSLDRRAVTVEVTAVEALARELGFRLEVAAPLPRGDRGQFLVEKLTELGATHFVPLQTSRSVVHPHEAKLDKLQRYVIEASKQCGRNVLLEVQQTARWPEYCRRIELPTVRLLADSSASPVSEVLASRRGADIAVAVGPEGGFTDEELGAGRSAGWLLVGLGPRVLRIETAAIILAAAVGQLPPPSREATQG
jgi:16S rRNA (uracil1498-N3)-methyltransferase